jgi:primosomal protein N' (replication factor Y)
MMNETPVFPGSSAVPTPTQSDLFGNRPSAAVPATLTGLFADIVFDRPLDHAYTYVVPERLTQAIAVGKRVLAPFGKGDRSTVGYCVRLSDQGPSSERSIKELGRVLDEEPLLDDKLLRLTRWLADYYLCGWGQVLNAVVPAGARKQAGTRSTVFLEAIPETELTQPPPKLSAKQTAALEHLRRAGKALEPARLAQLANCGLGPVDALVEKGVVRRTFRRIDRFLDSTDDDDIEPGPQTITLNGDQLKAWAPIEEAVQRGEYHAFLLHGVTGSGKTELYLRAIEQTVQQGKEALVLVPEISLTPQTIQRFRGRFGDVAVLHSHLGDAERGGQWRRVASGQVQVVVGARSAVFAPTRRLGLIVIDEEHESSFKQESTPRYHARDVAVMRARLENIPILLGSATPSLESWHNAERGQYTLLKLPNRVLDRAMPRVALVDMRHEKPGGGSAGAISLSKFNALSGSLERAMREALKTGGQVMLLLNRRGFSTHVYCPLCGHVESCKFCDLALTHHRQRGVLLCHYCGYEQMPSDRCPQCGHASIRFQGLGTEKLEAEIEAKFSGFVVRRMDSDTMKRPGSHAQVLSAFRHGLIHILLGTQMIAKGLDFPNVTLVGVINADVGLHVPDFRSAERTFQLLAQVAGRTGRGERGGKVLVQTFDPEQPAVALAARHDFLKFAEVELAHRKAHNYPPYQRLARLIIRSHVAEAAEKFAERLAKSFEAAFKKLESAGSASVRLLGPAEAPVFRLKGYYRFHFQLQSASSALLHQVLREVLPAARPPSNVEFTLDVDPHNML